MSKEAMKLETIMEQAQVFASAWALVGGRFDNGNMLDEAEVAKNELREMVGEALAEQPAQQEPVAVVYGYYGGQCVILPIDPARIFNSNTALYTSPPVQQQQEQKPVAVVASHPERIDWLRDEPPDGTLLYTSPQAQRKPLTDEQIDSIAIDVLGYGALRKQDMEIFTQSVRAIEAAHGIKENT